MVGERQRLEETHTVTSTAAIHFITNNQCWFEGSVGRTAPTYSWKSTGLESPSCGSLCILPTFRPLDRFEDFTLVAIIII